MASKLVQSEVGTWYKRLNFVRTNEGGLSAIADQSASQTPLTAVSTLVNGVVNTRTANAQLGVSDYAVTASNIASGKKILETDKSAIDAAILSLLRICNNQTSGGTCTQTTADTNGKHSNGSSQCYNGVDLGGPGHSQTGYENQCYNMTCSHNKVNSHGDKANGGCNHEEWSPAVYSNKNYYTEAEAIARVQ